MKILRIGTAGRVAMYKVRNSDTTTDTVLNGIDGKPILPQKYLNKLKLHNKNENYMKKHDKKDIKYLGVPNVCFSLVDENDKRDEPYSKDRIERGFDDSETWSMDYTFAKFMLPRLKRYQEIANDFLIRDGELVSEIDELIAALEIIVDKDSDWRWNNDETEKVMKGIENFPKVFGSLWW
jgi:hypothetical protein